jgi:hypothetical protein
VIVLTVLGPITPDPGPSTRHLPLQPAAGLYDLPVSLHGTMLPAIHHHTETRDAGAQTVEHQELSRWHQAGQDADEQQRAHGCAVSGGLHA